VLPDEAVSKSLVDMHNKFLSAQRAWLIEAGAAGPTPPEARDDLDAWFRKMERLDGLNLNAFDLLTDFCDVAIKSLMASNGNGGLISIVLPASRMEEHYIAVMEGRARLIRAASGVDSGAPVHAVQRARQMEAKFWRRFGNFVADSLSGGKASINCLFVDFGKKSLADVLCSMVSELKFNPDELENRVRIEVQRSFEDSGIATGAGVVESVRAGLPAVIVRFRSNLDEASGTYDNAFRLHKRLPIVSILGIGGPIGSSRLTPVKE
ncbi:MAG: hypothetical protein LBI17_00520, partial [Rickettsiales bacterium]|nr:hypothetical protein [Rickettsiales bacterium]